MMNIKTIEIAGFEASMRGMRNPMNSWHLNDSNMQDGKYIIGEKDLDLAQRLILAGQEHCKFLRQIQVWVDIDMPRYFWSEFDTYHFNTKNSCSTMHKLLNKKTPITTDLFVICPEDMDIAEILVKRLNEIREIWINSNIQKEKEHCLLRAKRLLMEGFLQLRTVNTNYAEIRSMYFQRRKHRLKEEWQDVFCTWVESLPYAKELILLEKTTP